LIYPPIGNCSACRKPLLANCSDEDLTADMLTVCSNCGHLMFVCHGRATDLSRAQKLELAKHKATAWCQQIRQWQDEVVRQYWG
jgi:hypothetical protein